MHRPRIVPLLLIGQGVVLVAALATAPVQTAAGTVPPEGARVQAPARTGRLAAATALSAGQPQASEAYAGDETCLVCHDDRRTGYLDGAHGRSAHPRTPAALQGCESCHGPGGKHVEAPSTDTIAGFSAMAPREINDRCLSCHRRDGNALWDGSTHDVRNLSCTSCHSVHGPRSAVAQLRAANETETCATCHRVQAMKVSRTAHMPLAEDKIQCSSCHNPHGSTNVKLLAVGNWVNESCVSCHTDRRGPFLFEHAAGRESCVSCHEPHGSSNDAMLVAKMPVLCQRCHIGTRHPSTIYDAGSVRAAGNRIVGRSCVNCHQTIHGSNHPSGHSFLR